MKKTPQEKKKSPRPAPGTDTQYRKIIEGVLALIRRGKLREALESAREGHRLGLARKDPSGTSQLLFILNELQLYDESALKAREFWSTSPSWDETVFANSLCAWVSTGATYLSDARALLKKYRFDSLEDWRRKLSSLEYTPSQITYIFNTALVFHHAGQEKKARTLLKEVLEHIIFHIDTATDGSRDLTDQEREYFALFLSLIGESDEFADLTETEGYRDLHEIVYGE